MFHSLFFDSERYDLSAVGRVKMNMRLDLDAEDTVRTLRKRGHARGRQGCWWTCATARARSTTSINLGNRRVRSVGELMENQYRLGLAPHGARHQGAYVLRSISTR